MLEAADELHSRFTPTRVLLGSLLLGAGLTVVGFLLGGSPSSAAEPAPPPSPVGALVSSATAAAGQSAGSVISAVAAVVPAPVEEVVPAVVASATPAVGHVASSSPATSVVDPVVAGADGEVAQLPAVRDVLPPAPVAAAIQPATGTVDQVVTGAIHATDTGVAPLNPPVIAPGTAVSTAIPGPTGAAPSVGEALVALGSASPAVRGLGDPPTVLNAPLGSGPSDPGPAPGTPPGPPGLPGLPGLPGDGLPGGSSAGGSAPGGAVPGAGATLDHFVVPASAWTGRTGAFTDDLVPVGPVGDHDISPD